MKVLERKAEGNWAKGELTTSILCTLEHAVCKFNYLLPRGWRLIVEGESSVGDLRLDVQSNRGGGSFAEVKMQTLKEATPLKFATGGDNLGCILQTVRNRMLMAKECQEYQEISRLTQASELTRAHHEWLRDEIGYTNFYGAIRVPYEEIHTLNTGAIGSMNCKGEIRLSFSGASQEQDVMFALRVLHGMQFYHCTYGNTQRWYNLRELCKVPNIELWLDLLKIEEAPLISSFRNAI